MARQTPVRADRQRNRGLLLAAATEVFAESGVQAPLDEVARRAGLSSASLYRHFPTRQDLLAAVFAATMDTHASAIRDALTDPSAWRGLCTYLTASCAMQVHDRALADLVTSPTHVDEHREQSIADLTQLLTRAKEEGSLRADASVEDVALILCANAGVVQRTPGSAASSPRVVALLLDGLRSGAQQIAAPPSREELTAALARSQP
jgi:AcrR family transcriptional regulator